MSVGVFPSKIFMKLTYFLPSNYFSMHLNQFTHLGDGGSMFPPKCQKKYSAQHVKTRMMTTIYPEHFAKPNCMHKSNLQQTYKNQTFVSVS
jgi:hypothetical protein